MSLHVAAALLIAGMAAGPLVQAVVASYARYGSLWPRTGRVAVAPTLLAGLLTGMAFLWVGHEYSSTPGVLVLRLAVALLLVIVLFIDVETRLIPTPLIAIVSIVGITMAALTPTIGAGSSLLGGGIGYAAFLMLVLLARLTAGRRALGIGDANLALAIGCLVGYPRVVDALLFGMVCGAAGALVLLVHTRADRHATMAYAPFLIIGGLAILGVAP